MHVAGKCMRALRPLPLLWIAVISCSTRVLGAEDHKSPRQPPIVLGVSNVQSGPSCFLGTQLLQGSKAYFDLVNAQGGIYGRHVEIDLKDDRYEPDPAVRNTNEFITKGNTFFLFDYVGTPTLTRVLPLLKYYEERHVVNVAPFTGASPQRTHPYDHYVFNIRASYIDEAHRLVDYLYAKGYRHIGFLGQADAYGKSGEMAVQMALAQHGLTLSGMVTYRRNQLFEVSMQAQVNLLRAKKTDAVIAFGVYKPCAAFVRDARMMGWNAPFASVSFVGAAQLLHTLMAASRDLGKNLTQNLISSQVVPSPNDVKYPLVKAFRKHISGDSAEFISLEGWLNATVVVEALRRAGPRASRTDFIHAMESLHGWDPGIGEKLAFSSTCHQGTHRVWLTRVDHDHWIPEDVGAQR